MTTKNRQTCLSAEMLRQLSHDELSPTELEDIEEHVSGCDRCRTLLEVAQSDPQWREEIVPILRTPVESPRAAGDHDDGGSGESLESILRMLGPTDDPHMLGRIGSYEVVGVIGRGGMGVEVRVPPTVPRREPADGYECRCQKGSPKQNGSHGPTRSSECDLGTGQGDGSRNTNARIQWRPVRPHSTEQ